jgi:hypothetical protein
MKTVAEEKRPVCQFCVGCRVATGEPSPGIRSVRHAAPLHKSIVDASSARVSGFSSRPRLAEEVQVDINKVEVVWSVAARAYL